MTAELLWLVIAVAVLLVAFALIYLAISVGRLTRDVRALTARSDHLISELEPDLVPTVRHLRGATANLETLAAEAQPRLRRADDLLEEAEATLVVLRSTLTAVEDTVRAPIDAVDGARRTVQSVAQGLVHGADRLRQRVAPDRDQRE